MLHFTTTAMVFVLTLSAISLLALGHYREDCVKDPNICQRNECCLALGQEGFCAPRQTIGRMCEVQQLTQDGNDMLFLNMCPCDHGLSCHKSGEEVFNPIGGFCHINHIQMTNMELTNKDMTDMEMADMDATDMGMTNMDATDMGMTDMAATDMGMTDMDATDMGMMDMAMTNMETTEMGKTDQSMANKGR